MLQTGKKVLWLAVCLEVCEWGHENFWGEKFRGRDGPQQRAGKKERGLREVLFVSWTEKKDTSSSFVRHHSSPCVCVWQRPLLL